MLVVSLEVTRHCSEAPPTSMLCHANLQGSNRHHSSVSSSLHSYLTASSCISRPCHRASVCFVTPMTRLYKMYHWCDNEETRGGSSIMSWRGETYSWEEPHWNGG